MSEKEAFDFADLITRYLKQELTPEEQEHFMQLLEADAEKRQLLEHYRDTFATQQRLDYMDSLDVEAAWDEVKRRKAASGKKRLNLRNRWLGYAAAFLLVSGMLYWWLKPGKDSRIVDDSQYGYKNDVLAGRDQAKLTLSNGRSVLLGGDALQVKERDGTVLNSEAGELSYADNAGSDASTLLYNTLSVPKAGTYRITLPDGTRVWVNSLSSLYFPVRFQNGERRVLLTGEAYFEVKEDDAHPFVVEVNGREIQVLGTSFNVSAYDGTTKATLLEGAVRVVNGSQNRLLQPGQEALVDSKGIIISKADMEKAIAWKEGHFYFSRDTIKSIMQQLARWYDLEINYEGGTFAGSYGGSISRQVSLGEVLEMLKDVSALNFEIEGRTVTVKEK